MDPVSKNRSEPLESSERPEHTAQLRYTKTFDAYLKKSQENGVTIPGCAGVCVNALPDVTWDNCNFNAMLVVGRRVNEQGLDHSQLTDPKVRRVPFKPRQFTHPSFVCVS